MLFCNYPTSNEFTLRNLQLCPQTSKLGSELRPIFRIHFAIFVRIPHIVSKCEISYYIYTFIVRKFQNFHDYCRPDRKRWQLYDFIHCIFSLTAILRNLVRNLVLKFAGKVASFIA